MQLTREADYALRTMLEVAAQPFGELTTTVHVSRRRLIPRPFVRKIVPRLAASGLLESRRGRRGGLVLGRPAADITLLQVIDAVREDTLAVNECVLRPEACALVRTCPIHEICVEARDRLVELFGSVRLSDMVARSNALKTDKRGRS